MQLIESTFAYNIICGSVCTAYAQCFGGITASDVIYTQYVWF